MKQEEIEEVLNKFETVQREAARVANIMIKADSSLSSRWDLDEDNIHLEQGDLLAKWQEIYHGCSPDHYQLYIPHDYLFNDKVLEHIEADAKLKTLAEKRRIAKNEKEAERREKIRRKAEFEKLKKEFENES